jgi:glycosyltransferase involved in cell wall biosynthesis
MKILMVHPHDIFSEAEPWTRRVREIAKCFARKGHQVKVVFFPLVKGDVKARECDGYEAIPFDRAISPFVFIKNVLAMKELATWADIVHFQKCHHYAALPAVIAAYAEGKPLHYDWDDWEEMIWYESCGKGLQSRFIGFSYHLLERFLPVLADTVSVASQYLKGLARQRGVREDRICYAPVGVDLEEFSPRISGKSVRDQYGIKKSLVLYLGQLNGAQYVDLFIEAAGYVLKKEPKTLFMIVGNGSMEHVLKKHVKMLDLEQQILFAGSVPHHRVPEHIAAADICVAVFKETKVTRCKSPLKIVEYMAMGKAIVASDVGELRDMLGGSGILVESGNAIPLAEKILELLQKDSLRNELGRRARQEAERKHDWSITAQGLLDGYAKILTP